MVKWGHGGGKWIVGWGTRLSAPVQEEGHPCWTEASHQFFVFSTPSSSSLKGRPVYAGVETGMEK